ncbi:MAG: hypothetical protein AB7Q17_12170 [Phycisphaerae bacterium]
MRPCLLSFGVLFAVAHGAVDELHAADGGDPQARSAQLLSQIVATQAQTFEQFSAIFSYRVEGEELRTPHPDMAPVSAAGAIVEGTVVYMRDGTREFVSARFDVAGKYKYHAFQEVDAWHDFTNNRSVRVLIPSRQVLIERYHGASIAPPPGVAFLAHTPSSVAERIARGSTFERVDRDGVVGFHLSAPTDGGGAVDGVVDPELDFAITEWAEEGGLRARIEWERQPSGVVPVRAVLSNAAGDRRWTLETQEFHIGPPDPQQLEFRFSPDMLVADHVDLTDGKPQVYKIDENGRRVDVLIAIPPQQVSLGQRGGVAGVAGLLVVGALVLRFRR